MPLCHTMKQFWMQLGKKRNFLHVKKPLERKSIVRTANRVDMGRNFIFESSVKEQDAGKDEFLDAEDFVDGEEFCKFFYRNLMIMT